MNRRFGVTMMVLAFLIGLMPKVLLCDETLTDQQKTDIVYNMYMEYRKEFPHVREISPKAAMKEMALGKILFVDTRKPAEMEVSMLPGAITWEEFLKDPEKFKDRRIVAYCTISYRSGKLARKLSNKGIEIFNLQGGLLAWVLEGGKVYNSNGKETRRINVFGEKWDYPPKGYESVRLGFFERYF
jgi:rhodanese-related sulfurtransferase